ncbi:MAG: HAMP domain-containing protein [Acidimicrobiia bacterium]|nr:HAMP domain-containing protein [Actinomycetota bacterium]MBL6925225.1 HAMP domain-containing protein [Acidimicrobiia bacterium]MBL6926704.1 HAMP domain-containing protein [Acidimicrobiia bacterium]
MTRRLLLSFLTVTVLVLLALEIPLAMFFGDRERERFASLVENDATVLASIYEDTLDGDAPLEPIHADSYRLDTGARVVLVDTGGISLVDTDAGVPRDFSTRPEIATAVMGRHAVGTRYSETLEMDLLYVAVPVASGGTVHGAIRITLPTADVDARVQRFWWGLVALGAMILVVMAGLSWILARSVTSPVERLRRTASGFAAGDLTGRVVLEGAPPELRQLGEALNVMAARLDSLLESQRQFVADASHQLRTPLTALRLRIENIGHLLGPGHDEDLAAVLDETERLTTLVEQLLELSRAERSIEVEEVDLVRLATDRVDTWSAVAGEREVTIVLSAPDDAAAVAAAPGSVDQILDNLLDNAVAVAPPGSTVTVSVERRADAHVLAVADRGPGLSDADKQRATDRFWRGDADRPGTGLGLAIVRSLVEAHGGQVQLVDVDGGGLKVEVGFPASL